MAENADAHQPDDLAPDGYAYGYGDREPRPSEPVIVSRTPARGVPSAAAMPGRALVFSDCDGRAVHLTAPPRSAGGRPGGAGYEWRFEVDTAPRTDTFAALVPSRTEAARFVVAVEAVWSVTDPARVVRRGVRDGARLVRSRVLAVARSVGNGYRIEQVRELEAALAGRLGAGHLQYPEGITVHRCHITAGPDGGPAGCEREESERAGFNEDEKEAPSWPRGTDASG